MLAEAKEAQRVGRSDAEDIARRALEMYASALNWSEDTDEFEPNHRAMDEAGRWVRETFGCELEQKDGRYYRTCPVDLAHRRIGMSVEFIAKSIKCSICGQLIQDCDHIAGRDYDDQRCGRIIDKIDEVIGVALVSRPAQPDARLTSISLDTEDLRRALPPQWKPWMPVSCDKCLDPCRGIEEVDLTALGAEQPESRPGSSEDRHPARGRVRLA